MMNNAFYDFFYSKSVDKNLTSVIYDFSSKRSSFKDIVFVEGLVDKNLYSKIVYKKLNARFKGDIGFIICGNKKNVIDMQNYLINNKCYKKNNYFHIVDRDYDGISKVSSLCKEKLTTTKFYSLESYILDKENCVKLLEYLNFTEESIVEYFKLFNKFCELILDFESLIAFQTINEFGFGISKNYLSKDVIKIENDDVFILTDIDNKFKNIYDKFDVKNKKMFLLLKEKLGRNYLFLRGHALEEFFNKYLEMNNMKKTMHELLLEFNDYEKMTIDINIR